MDRNRCPRDRALKTTMDRFDGRHYHFIGVGGIGMSSLARLLAAWGAVVSGSDRSDSAMLGTLRDEGILTAVGHDVAHVCLRGRPDFVIYSKAVPPNNPELEEARRLGVVTLHRAELLGQVMVGRKAVCVCGTHGKTTTTAMLALILQEVGQDPAVMLGGEYPAVGGNVRRGQGPAFVAEACEAYGSFLSLYPDLAVVTNIEADHLDRGATFDDIRDSFRTFLQRVPAAGVVIAGIDSPEVRRLLPEIRCPVETFAVHPEESAPDHATPVADWTAGEGEGGVFEVRFRGERVTALRLQVPGQHNLSNALAAIAAAHALGVSPGESTRAIERFTGVGRRFTVLGAAGGVMVVDDYAHHPTEIRATLAAARGLFPESGRRGAPAHDLEPGTAAPGPAAPGPALPDGFSFNDRSRLIAVFQPHLYTRTSLFMDDFAASIAEADIVVLTEIYAAREAPIPGVTGAALAERVTSRFPTKTVQFVPDLGRMAEMVSEVARPGDLVVLMGAGDITSVGPKLMEALWSRPRVETAVG